MTTNDFRYTPVNIPTAGADLSHLLYRITIKLSFIPGHYSTEIAHLLQWLVDNVGTPYNDWATSNYMREDHANGYAHITIYFHNEADATYAALRWS